MYSLRALLPGAAAAGAALAVAEAAAALTGRRSTVDLAAQLVVDRVPRSAVEIGVRLLRSADKPAIRASVVGAVLASGALAGATGRSRRRGPTAAALAGAGAVAGAGIAAAWRRQTSRREHQDAVFASRPLSAARPLPPARDGAEHWPGASPLLTPVQDFYVTDVAMRSPVVDVHRWRLTVCGEVRRPLSVGYADLLDDELVEFDAAMVCIHNRLGWDRLGNQRWTGLPLSRLLERVEPTPAAGTLVTRSVDGWECSLPLRLLADHDAYLVLGMGGRALTASHGFPARVFVPGLYGQYAGAKWLTELRLQATPNRDYWQGRGWPHGPVPVRPMARIDAPAHRGRRAAGPVTVTGVAWAPAGGVGSVEVSLDGGPWTGAELAGELAPAAWRRWRADLVLDAGTHELRARCLGRDGRVQDGVPRDPFPSGASGYHRVRLRVA
ncbi:MAG: molybdopterin-dependent oxidoreductase [Actinomycetes bacterium]